MSRIPRVLGLPPKVITFLESFYTISDFSPDSSPTANETYASFFTNDVDFRMGPASFKGREEVVKWRESAWKDVSSRRHDVEDVFICLEQEQKQKQRQDNGTGYRIMLNGKVRYGLKNGPSEGESEWAAVMNIREVERGEISIDFYQVYLISRPMN